MCRHAHGGWSSGRRDSSSGTPPWREDSRNSSVTGAVQWECMQTQLCCLICVPYAGMRKQAISIYAQLAEPCLAYEQLDLVA